MSFSTLLYEKRGGRSHWHAPMAVALANTAVLHGLDSGIKQGAALEQSSAALLSTTGDFRKGHWAGLAGRKTWFAGR